MMMRSLVALCIAASLGGRAAAAPVARHAPDRNEIASAYTFVTNDVGFEPARTLEAVRDALLGYRPATDLPESAFPKMSDLGTAGNIAQLERLAMLTNDHVLPAAKANADVPLWIVQAMTNDAVLEPRRYESDIAGPLGDIVHSFGFTSRFDVTGRRASIRSLAQAPFANPDGLQTGDEVVSIDGIENPYASNAKAVAHVVASLQSDDVAYVFKRGAVRIAAHVRDVRARYGTVDEARAFGGVTYVHMNGIGTESGNDTIAALAAPELAGTHGLVLDLRDTEAGTIDEAVDFISHFTKPGIDLGTYVSHAGMRALETRAAPQIAVRPIVVICDSLTRDGGVLDLIATTLRREDRARLIGTRSLGIRAVRDRIQFADDSGAAMVAGHVFFPGESPATPIAKRVLVPDLFVDRDDAFDNVFDDPKTDPQLRAALVEARGHA